VNLVACLSAPEKRRIQRKATFDIPPVPIPRPEAACKTRPDSPQCIEQSAVCNSKSAGSSRFVTLFGIRNRRVRRARGREHLWERLEKLSNPAAMETAKSRKFSAKNQPFPDGAGEAGEDSCKTLQKDCEPRVDSVLHFCGVSRHLARYPDASEESWGARGLPGAPTKGLNHRGHEGTRRKTLSSVSRKSVGACKDSNCPSMGAEGRLTCVSFRCLSSYLIFPPVPVTSKPRAGWPVEIRQREAGTACAPPRINPLI